jgi:uncharacterized protein (DUF4415 family)
MPKRSESSARGKRAGKKERRARVRRVDFSDMPEASPERRRAVRRVGRPPIGEQARQLIAIRLDPRVIDEFRKEAKRRNVGYQTLINEVLAKHVTHVA